MKKCKHKAAGQLEGGRPRDFPIKWCPDCGALFVLYETERGTVSKRPKWLIPKRPRVRS